MWTNVFLKIYTCTAIVSLGLGSPVYASPFAMLVLSNENENAGSYKRYWAVLGNL